MATIIGKANGANSRTWECKQCHQLITEQQTVAYHLVDRVLYGWCETCFSQRSVSKLAA